MKNTDSSELLTPVITRSQGIGGKIKSYSEDFIVCEIIENNIKLDPREEEFELPGKPGLFLHLVLIKKDIDTSDALDWIAKLWKLDRNDISIAGSKDKKALTAQRVCIWGLRERFDRGELERIDLPTIKTLSLNLKLKGIRLGDLWGNAFDISIREISKSLEETRDQIEKLFEEVKELGGVQNGFGIQRFGELRPITHHVGKKLVQGDFKQALRLYLGKVFEGESEEIQRARKSFWENENCNEALELFPSFLSIERKILRLLLKNRMNYKQVFFALPQQFRKLFVHAYQAQLFNKYLTIRWDEHSQNLQESITGEKIQNNRIYAPIIGRKTVLTGDVQRIYEGILNDERIDFSIFQNPEIQKIGGVGTFRSISFLPRNLHIKSIEQDDANISKTKAEISFEIQKGSYATELLREITKN
ncbi:MAG: tRNA pseudouridine(13) synthase TruD [Candidatus Heimdallarchaeota archaeon]|nr:tRNA pseudouridine(13) synthase TruD [Candidatus Heimdallarchaeota archaeon]